MARMAPLPLFEAGTYYLILFLDSDNLINEQLENNNFAFVHPFTVTPRGGEGEGEGEGPTEPPGCSSCAKDGSALTLKQYLGDLFLIGLALLCLAASGRSYSKRD